ncbi:hypothetical protein JCM4914_03740 [Streptomyces platensis subsp. malvinus]
MRTAASEAETVVQEEDGTRRAAGRAQREGERPGPEDELRLPLETRRDRFKKSGKPGGCPRPAGTRPRVRTVLPPECPGPVW